MGQVHIHALGINSGGGLVLLRQLIQSESSHLKYLILDERVKKKFSHHQGAKFYKHGFLSEYKSQKNLKNKVKPTDHILFFSNRPPLIKFPCLVSVFHQNALLLGAIDWKSIKNKINQSWLKVFNANADQFIVQNHSMKIKIQQLLGQPVLVQVSPFTEVKTEKLVKKIRTKDFIYVASFLPHKNYENLIKAWDYLFNNDLKVGLTLVASGNNLDILKKRVKESSASSMIDVVTGLDRDQVYEQMLNHKTLIYPSLSESLGLPLLEAKSCQLSIVASELDFVRDIVNPAQTFDPHSHISIARSVMRHLSLKPLQQVVLSPDQFLNDLAKSSKVSQQKAS